MSGAPQQVRVASTYEEMKQMFRDENVKIAAFLRGQADEIERGDSPNQLFHMDGHMLRSMVVRGIPGDDMFLRCVFALLESEKQLQEVEHGEVTIKIQDCTPVLVQIGTKHKVAQDW